ncbi:molybdenum transport ATP-binding protein ModC [Salmonella enterica subsp. enterica]|nr:molybdenum transport ATP-binding protein ModC [Salmonella enterica subsp. enterica]
MKFSTWRIKSWCWRMDRLKRLARWKKSGEAALCTRGCRKEQQSSILKVSVLEHHPHYAMTALALGDQHLWVNKLNQPLQSTLRIRIQASDVSLVLQPPAADQYPQRIAGKSGELL